jgi:hypothetical protein
MPGSEISAMLFGMTIGEFHLGVLVGFRGPPSKSLLEKRIRDGVAIFLAGSVGAMEPAGQASSTGGARGSTIERRTCISRRDGESGK